MTSGTRGAGSASDRCQNVTIHNVSTIKLTKSLNAHASVDDDRKDTDLSNQAEVDTVDETEDSETTGAGGRTGSTGAGQGAASGTGGTKDDTQARESDDGQKDQEDNADGTADTAGAAGSSSDSSTGAASDTPAGSEPAADVLVLAAAPGRDGAEAPEILLEGLESPSSDALEGLDIDALVALLPSLGFSGTQDSVVRLPAPAATTTPASALPGWVAVSRLRIVRTVCRAASSSPVCNPTAAWKSQSVAQRVKNFWKKYGFPMT